MVTRIVRLKAPDYSTKKNELKDYLVWYENWYTKNRLGGRLPPVADNIEGFYQEQEKEPVIEKMKLVGCKRSGQHIVHYVPFK